MALAPEVGNTQATYIAFYVKAMVAQTEGDYEQAIQLFEEGLKLSAEAGDETNASYCMEGLAAIAALQGRLVRAARLWGAAQALLEAIESTAYIYAPDRSIH